MKKGLLMLAALLLASTVCLAQDSNRISDTCKKILQEKVVNSGKNVSADLAGFFTFGGGGDCMTELLLTQYQTASMKTLIDEAQSVKTALQQDGASAGSGSGTSLVSKGMAAQMFSAALEYGGITEATSGQAVTLSGSLGGIPAALIKQETVPNCGEEHLPLSLCVSNRAVNRMNRLAYSVSFNTGSSSQTVAGTAAATGSSAAQPATFTGYGNAINSATGKFVILRGAAASISDIAKKINTAGTVIVPAVSPAQQAKDKANVQTLWNYDSVPAVKAWTRQTAQKVLAAGQANAVAAWVGQASALMDAVCPPDGQNAAGCRSSLLASLGEYGVFVNTYKAGVNTFVESLRKAPLLTFEYDFNRPASQPTNSTFRLVGQSVLGGWTLTLNGAVSIYDSTPSSAIPGASLLRDVQAAGEASYDLSKLKQVSFLGHSTASAAYYFQDQTSPAILNVTPGQPVSGVTITNLPSGATQVYAQTGDISIAQGKFTYSPGSSSISIPFSFTWSNRTELVTNSTWRGQVGICYDFDSLFGSSK